MSTDRNDTITKSDTSHPDCGPLVILCPPTVDGGIKLRWRVPALALAPELHTLLARVGPCNTTEPLPMPSEHGARSAVCRQHASGRVTVDIAGEVKIVLCLASRLVELRLGAVALWREGYATIAARWIGTLMAWLAGKSCEFVDAQSHGWRVTFVPIAVDTHGLTWDVEDAFKFTGRGLRQVTGRERESVSLRIGQTSSPVGFLIYPKTRELATRRHRSRADYEPVWEQAPGYDSDRDVERVELQLRGAGLEYRDTNTGEIYDLRDPFTLTRADALAAVWSYQTHMRRWIVLGCATRNRRAPTDPRWVVIQAAVSCPQPRLRQLRESQQQCREHARDNALGRLWRLLGDLAALHGIAVERGGLASWLRLVAVMLGAHVARRRLDALAAAGESRRRSYLWGEATAEEQGRILALMGGVRHPGVRLISLPRNETPSKWPPNTGRLAAVPDLAPALSESDNAA